MAAMRSMPPMTMPPTSGAFSSGPPPQYFQSAPNMSGGPLPTGPPPPQASYSMGNVPQTMIPGSSMSRGGSPMTMPPGSMASMQGSFMPGPMMGPPSTSMPPMNSMGSMNPNNYNYMNNNNYSNNNMPPMNNNNNSMGSNNNYNYSSSMPPMNSMPPMGSMGSMYAGQSGPNYGDQQMRSMPGMGSMGPPLSMEGQYTPNVARPQMSGVANPPVTQGNMQYGPSYKMQYQKRSSADKSAVKYTGFLPLEGVYEEDTCRVG
eukprot:CAMPEP_0115076410 /NCGR_PEP_ID=MMETSP0227-20121206/16417_1 /TAXON_ID=89957 /ORGANISM="Polarella glacialis, Strain CCMP 1383" /LENGTH=259 /DNA_ID=CAMNT_0002463559 /DNA_START=62 /DNA_END=841 /DNA_ORIENTATION=+